MRVSAVGEKIQLSIKKNILLCFLTVTESVRLELSEKWGSEYFLIDPATDGLSDCSTHYFAS